MREDEKSICITIRHHRYDDETQKRGGRLNRAALEDLKRYHEEIRLAHPGQVFEDSWNCSVRPAKSEQGSEKKPPLLDIYAIISGVMHMHP